MANRQDQAGLGPTCDPSGWGITGGGKAMASPFDI